MQWLETLAIWVVPVVFAITVHEVAHGWVASLLGDQTARLLGRLTLNPVKHVDPVGTILLPGFLLLVSNFVFGWARPVPVDNRNLRSPRRDMALVAAAGPGANLLMLIGWLLFAKLLIDTGVARTDDHFLLQVAFAGVSINVVLMVLNLIPLPPLDGSRVVMSLLPPALARSYAQLERWGLVILLGLMVAGLLDNILGPPVRFVLTLAERFLTG
jgi:Zn-dependent protease